MILLNWLKYGKIINVIILMKFLKKHYTSFYIAIDIYIDIYGSK